MWGLTCDPTLETYAKKKGIPLLFDSAHSFGSRDALGRAAGSMGCAEIFSLHATKLFNSFEGGLITTNDDELALRIVAMRNFGITGQDKVDFIGTNCKLSEVHAAFATLQLNCIEDTKQVYHENAKKYSTELHNRNLSGISLWNDGFFHTRCTQSYVLLVVESDSPISRDALMEGLREKEVYAKRYFFPGTHKYKCYEAWPPRVALDSTDWLNEHLLTLPTGKNVSFDDIEQIVRFIAELHSEAQLNKLKHEMNPTIMVDESKAVTRKAYVQQKIQSLLSRVKEYEEELKYIDNEFQA